MRTSAKILRRIGRSLTQLDWAYAGPRQLGPWLLLLPLLLPEQVR